MMKNYLILLFISLSLCFSCNSSETGSGNTPVIPEEDKLVLSVDKVSVFTDGVDKVVFTVLNQAGKDVTADCKFTVNNKENNTAFLTTSTKGEYKIVAKRNELTSNTVVVNAVEKVFTDYELTADKNEVIADGGDFIVLQLKTKEGVDVTASAQFYANNEKIGSTFSTGTKGSYIISAKIDNVAIDKTITITAKEVSSFTYRVLVEDFTSVKCQYCPGAIQNLASMMNGMSKKDQIILVSPHSDLLGSDPLTCRNGLILADILKVSDLRTLPVIRLNRDDSKNYYGNEFAIADKVSGEAKVGISMKTKVVDGNVEIESFVSSKTTFSNLYISFMLIEDGIVYPQLWSGKGTVQDYVHNHVLKAIAPDVKSSPLFLGNVIASLEPGKAQCFKQTMSLEGCNYENCSIVAVVGSVSLKAVRAVQQVKVGQSIAY